MKRNKSTQDEKTTEKQDQPRRDVWQTGAPHIKTAPALLRFARSPCGDDAHADKRDGKSKTESRHHSDAESKCLQLKTNQQNRYGSRAGYQAASKAEPDYFAG